MKPPGMKLESVPITDLKPARYNPRRMDEPETVQLMRAIENYGMVEPLVINKDGTVIGGHQRLRVVQRLGWTKVPCVRLDLSLENEKALNIALNKIKGSFDVVKLRDVLVELDRADVDPETYGFTEEEIAQAHAEASRTVDDALRDNAPHDDKGDDDLPEIHEGDVFKIGPHVLACGWPDVPDLLAAGLATLEAKQADLLFGVRPVKRRLPKRVTAVKNEDVLRSANQVLKAGGAAYYGVDHHAWGETARVMADILWHFSNVIMWILDQPAKSKGDYAPGYIPLVYGWKDGDAHYIRPERNRPDVWNLEGDVTADLVEDVPVALCREVLRNNTRLGEAVLSVFGTGAMLEAAHQMGRLALIVEPDPETCAKIILRGHELLEAT